MSALDPDRLRRPDLLHRTVTGWYGANARDLPWRRTTDPYAILVSEIMLQQTQVERVVPKYEAFLQSFPTLDALAAAEAGEVIRVWAGLGYNGRAVRLHRLAQAVEAEHGGRLPEGVGGLRRLPGIGPYTAAAVACFAFGASVPLADTNVYRVVSRVTHGAQAPSRREVDGTVAELVPAVGASAWYQGLMDIGATVCTARPDCSRCPLESLCAAAPALRGDTTGRLAEASVPYAPKQSAFAGSRRYFRGRVVDALRSLAPGEALPTAALADIVLEASDAVAGGAWLDGLLVELEREGLVLTDGGRVRLP